MSSIPYTELNPTTHFSPTLHFAHANGYPPQAYTPLLERLSERFHVTAMEMRPLWEDSSLRRVRDWGDFVGDMITFLESVPRTGSGKKPVVGVGHSLGGDSHIDGRDSPSRVVPRLDPARPAFFPAAGQFDLEYSFSVGIGVLVASIGERSGESA